MLRLLTICTALTLLFSCQKDPSPNSGTNPNIKQLPEITTLAVSNISSTTVTSGGTLVSNGNDSITARGICWSTTPLPTTSNFHNTDTGSSATFYFNIQGLTKNQTYYIRSYATNSIGTAYGNQISFTTDSVVHVYITGTSAGRCTYWKDGVPTPFTNSGTYNNAEAYSIFVENNDVYVAGYETNLNSNVNEGKIWKNGVGSRITSGNSNSYATAVAIVNNDMYVLGNEVNPANNKTEGKIWKNGVSTNLLSISNPAEGLVRHAYPKSLFIYNNNAYAGGYEIFEPNADLRGLVWKNGTPTRYFGLCYGAGGSCTYDYTQVNDIFIVGNDVYAIGTSPSGTTGVLDNILWKNGVPSAINIIPSSIFVNNNDIYIAGRVGNSASIWKNGNVTQLTNGVKQGFATSVYVKDNDVYVAGFERDPVTAFSVGKVWKNGIVTNLTDGSGTAEITDMFVK